MHDINLSNFEFNVEKKNNRKGAFPSCLLPLCQNESECETMHMKRSIHFHKKGFARRLLLKRRHKITGKLPKEMANCLGFASM